MLMMHFSLILLKLYIAFGFRYNALGFRGKILNQTRLILMQKNVDVDISLGSVQGSLRFITIIYEFLRYRLRFLICNSSDYIGRVFDLYRDFKQRFLKVIQ